MKEFFYLLFIALAGFEDTVKQYSYLIEENQRFLFVEQNRLQLAVNVCLFVLPLQTHLHSLVAEFWFDGFEVFEQFADIPLCFLPSG